VADPSTCADALAILQRYRITVPPAALALLESGAGETLKPGDAGLARCETRLVSSPQIGLEAAARVARDAGYSVCVLGDSLEGEAREVGRVMAGIAQQVATHGQPLKAPCVLLSGGETTVTVRGAGRGGRNVEFLLALGVALKGQAGVWALAGDTDGVDGIEEIAGALLAPDTLARARELGIKATERLDDNDGHGFFGALGDAVITGPTLTNINDFRAILIQGA
jgi:hydroxypyruvate reductase